MVLTGSSGLPIQRYDYDSAVFWELGSIGGLLGCLFAVSVLVFCFVFPAGGEIEWLDSLSIWWRFYHMIPHTHTCTQKALFFSCIAAQSVCFWYDVVMVSVQDMFPIIEPMSIRPFL